MNNVIHPATRLGAVHLIVSDLERSIGFYTDVLGFQIHRHKDNRAHLGANGPDLFVLTQIPGAKQGSGTTGLYHFAVLVPNRKELAVILSHIAESQTAINGIVDHHISEVIYLPDPDGNGIEIYRDRKNWREHIKDAVRLGNFPLDTKGVMGELDGVEEAWNGLDPDTVIGHIHLHVGDIRRSDEFYKGILGFEKSIDFGPTAAFVSAGGYHHHIGYNLWAGPNAQPPPTGSIGLKYFVIQLPDENELQLVEQRAQAAGLELEEKNGAWLTRDPSQNGILLKSAVTQTQTPK